MRDGKPEDLYSRLMAVKPDDLSANAWAIRAGVNRNVFNDVKKRGRLRQDILEKLLAAIDLTLADFGQRTNMVIASEVAPASMPAIMRATPVRGARRSIPLLGSAIGGEYEEGIEMTELYLSETLAYLAAPLGVEDDDSTAYAVTIVGDSMSPRYEPGEQAYITPRAPISIGDDVIVQLKGGPANGDDGDRVTQVLIKRLVRRSGTHVELRQFNPDTTFKVPNDRIAAMHRVRGRY